MMNMNKSEHLWDIFMINKWKKLILIQLTLNISEHQKHPKHEHMSANQNHRNHDDKSANSKKKRISKERQEFIYKISASGYKQFHV